MLKILINYYKDFRYRIHKTKHISDSYTLSLFLKIWVSDRLLKLSPISASLPWMPYSTILKLNYIIKKDFNILETGSGGSSLFYLRRCNNLTSLEHDDKWLKEVDKNISLTSFKKRWTVVLKQLNEKSKNKSPYLQFLRQLQDESFDLISVDGRLRSESLKIVSKKVKKGGYLLLDNSDRNEYKEGIEFIDNLGWSKQDFNGFCYSLEWDSKSTMWRRN
jgi:tRNA A58 N-methylase Trm61